MLTSKNEQGTIPFRRNSTEIQMSEDTTPTLPMETVPSQVNGYELQKTACCFFLKEAESNNLVKLNDTSALIWQVCTGEWSVGEIIDVLMESYPDAADGMKEDVFRTLEQLKEEGVIELKEAA